MYIVCKGSEHLSREIKDLDVGIEEWGHGNSQLLFKGSDKEEEYHLLYNVSNAELPMQLSRPQT